MSNNRAFRRLSAAALASFMALAFTASAYAEKDTKYGSIKKYIELIEASEKDLNDGFFNPPSNSYYSNRNLYNYDVDKPSAEMIDLPGSYDLRNVDGKCYVTEVKDQTPFGTCWAFGTIAASEISIATALGIDLNTATNKQKKALDLSEHHLVWFAQFPVQENDPKYPTQAGEGLYLFVLEDDTEKSVAELSESILNSGGYGTSAIYLFDKGVGPALESDAPYNNNEGYHYYTYTSHFNKEGNMIDPKLIADGYSKDYNECLKMISASQKSYSYYTDVLRGKIPLDTNTLYSFSFISRDGGTWDIDESKKYIKAYCFSGADYLPNPAGFNDTSYVYNELGTYSIKKEIYEGHGVIIGINGDSLYLGDQADTGFSFMNYLTLDGTVTTPEQADIWAQYAFDPRYDPSDPDSINLPLSSNHTVTIVGYDDNFPKEYFNDPNGTIGGNGAFIAKNSWGSINNSVPISKNMWGNGGDGYFYISYYDQSFEIPTAYIFRPDNESDVKSLDTDMYDHAIQAVIGPESSPFETFFSNVFTAKENEFIKRIGTFTLAPNTTLDYTVYLLSENYQAPTDGVKKSEGSIKIDYAGYHTIDLAERVPVHKGQSYSVIFSYRQENGSYSNMFSSVLNRNGIILNDKLVTNTFIEETGDESIQYKSPGYYQTVVNPGESFVGVQTKKGVVWEDFSEIIKIVTSDNENVLNNGISYDNFGIRAYPQTEIIAPENAVTDPGKSYAAGDILKGKITITNNGTEPLKDVELILNLGKLGADNKLGKISVIRPGKTKTINYTYKVKRSDVKKGSITSTLSVKTGGKKRKVDADVFPLTFTVDTVA